MDLPGPRAHQGDILRECAALIEAGRLRIQIAHSLPLEQAARAHELIATGHTHGKIVLTL
jgi:NADPH2:quinone reductase